MEIDRIFEMIADGADAETRRKGIEEGRKVRFLSVFCQPREGKRYWDGCAEILVGKTDAELKPYLFDLLEWLKDLTWPGADRVFDRLTQFFPEEIEQERHICMQMAEESGDEVWRRNLTALRSAE